MFQNLKFCQSQRPRFNPLEADSYPGDKSDAEGDKGRDANVGKRKMLKHNRYKHSAEFSSLSYLASNEK